MKESKITGFCKRDRSVASNFRRPENVTEPTKVCRENKGKSVTGPGRKKFVGNDEKARNLKNVLGKPFERWERFFEWLNMFRPIISVYIH